MPIDFVISRVNNVDRTDKHGTTSLHRAVTIGEVYTKRLLEAGANPAKATHEGLTPLHLASRSRQSNVVGMLLEALRHRTPSYAVPVSGVDAVVFKLTSPHAHDQSVLDAYPTTPLFYACRSGRPETVALLLEAGADIKKGNVLHACAGLESENEVWERLPEDSPGDQKQMRLMVMDELTVLGLKCPLIPGRLRVDETARLEEILDMLAKHGLNPTDISHVDRCDQVEDEITETDSVMYKHGQLDKNSSFIDRAFFKQDDYTGACFRATCDSAKKEKGFSISTPLESLYCSSKNVVYLALRSPGEEVYRDTLDSFLRRREYPLVEEMARLGAQFLPISANENRTFLF